MSTDEQYQVAGGGEPDSGNSRWQPLANPLPSPPPAPFLFSVLIQEIPSFVAMET